MKIIAEIEPVPLGRPRINTKTLGRYLPTKSAIFKHDLEIIAKASMKKLEMEKLTSKLAVTIKLYKKCKPEVIIKRSYGDLDNHVKAILDALNGIVYADDGQVVELHAFKYLGEPRIEIEIEELENGNVEDG